MKTEQKVFLGVIWWLWQLTWGALLTYIGLIVTLFCIIFLKGKPHKNGFSYIVEVGGNWGGLELGAVALCGSYSQKDKGCYDPAWYQHTRKHEFGHNVQQLIFGPLQLFIVGIPSICRYWYQVIAEKHGKQFSDDWYDSAWFEGTATRWGTKWIDTIEYNKIDTTTENILKVVDDILNKHQPVVTETNKKETIGKTLDSSANITLDSSAQ